MRGEFKLNNIVSFHQERDLVYVTPEEFLKSENVPLQNMILTLNIVNQTSKIDLAKICFKDWVAATRKAPNRIRHIVSPVRGTLRDSTTLNTIRRYIAHNIVIGDSYSTIKGDIHLLVRILQELDSLGIEQDWSDKNSQLNAYKRYSEYLYLEFQKVLKDETVGNTFYMKQALLANFIGFNIDLEPLNVKKVAWQAPLQQNNHRKPVGQNELKAYSNVNLLIFRNIKTFLMGDKVFPLIIESKKLGVHCIESHTNRTSEYYDIFIGENGEFLDYEKAKARYVAIKKNLKDERLILIYEKYKATYEERNKPFNLFRIRLINKAVNAFVACIFCDSAINPSLVTQLLIDSFDNLIATNKTIRTYLIKNRANKKLVPVSFTASFKKIAKEFIEFREWVLNNLPLDPLFEEKTLLFSINEVERKSENQITRLVAPYKLEHYSGAYKNWLQSKFPSIDYIPASIARASITNYYHQKSGSSVVIAEKAGNTPKTTEKAYSEATPEQFYGQMNEYFNAVYKASFQRNRVSEKLIPVKIQIGQIEENVTTPIGQCSSAQQPQLDAGFQNISQPNCSNPASCLFCDKYVLHTDAIDIKKLLSLKEMTFLSINRSKEDEVLYIRHRIDEILEQAVAAYPETAEIIEAVEREIENGNYAEYWQQQIDLITELMDY